MNIDTLEKTKQPSTSLIWSHVSVQLHQGFQLGKKKNSRQLLKNVSGISRSGEILAILGGSGVGKTTLMNVLSGRHSQGLNIQGEIYLNNMITTSSQRIHNGMIEHVEQYELFMETMTLEEHLVFQAMLRMPRRINDAERRLHVTNVIEKSHLTGSQKTPIRYLSGGEVKRLGFATALLTNPRVLLVDEPTSGLDTYLAKSFMNLIHSLAIERDQAIIVVLHQPTTTIFESIDKIYLLAEDGKLAFFGTKTEAEQFFIDTCHLSPSSLDTFIEQFTAPPDIADNKTVTIQSISVTQFVESGQAALLDTTIQEHLQSIDKENTLSNVGEMESSTFGRQLKWLLWRSLVSIKRNPNRTTKLVIRLTIMALILGFTFFQLDDSTIDYFRNVDALLLLPFSAILENNMTVIVTEMTMERPMVIWEYRRRLYSLSAYYICRLIIDICFQIITTLLFISVITLLAGLPHWILIACGVILVVIAGGGLAAFIGAVASTPQAALLIIQPVINFFAAFSGYFININSIPVYMAWIKYISPHYYGFHLLLVLQWYHTNFSIPCEVSILPTPLVSNTTTMQTDTCTVTGNSILSCFDIRYQYLASYILGLILLAFFFHLGAFIISLIRVRRAM